MENNLKYYVAFIVFVILIFIFGTDPNEMYRKRQQAGFDEKIERSLATGPDGQNVGAIFGTPSRTVPVGRNDSAATLGLPGQETPAWMRDPLANRKAPVTDAKIAAAASATPAFVPDAYLRSGERLQFIGPQIFRLSADGKRDPLPDGDYVLSDGRAITVRDGKRIKQ